MPKKPMQPLGDAPGPLPREWPELPAQHHHPESHIERQLFRIRRSLFFLHRKVIHMNVDMERLKAAIAKNTEVDQSVMVLLDDVIKRLREATDLTEVKAFADKLEADNAALAAKVEENTAAA